MRPRAETPTPVSIAGAWQRAYAAGHHASPWPTEASPGAEAGRAASDARAAWERWHVPAVQARFSAAQRPWYALLERARVETLASVDLPGVMRNLALVDPLLPSSAAGRAVYRAARDVFRDQVPDRIELAPPARESEAVLGRWWSRRRDARPASRASLPGAGDVLRTLGSARAVLDDAPAFAAAVEPLVTVLASCYADAEASPPAGAAGDHRRDRPGDLSAPDEEAEAEIRVGALAAEPATASERARDAGYAIYDARWDEVVDAAELPDARDAPELLTDAQRQQVAHLAQRLQRRLLAARLRRWSFDEDEGLLDNRSLPRLLTPGGSTAVFRQERIDVVPEACVTLLVDQSGSMRGERQRIVALAVAFAAQTLERCRIRCEVLGYTTRFGADNPVAAAWRSAGSPARPGRLNALRHIVYKSAGRPWRQSQHALRLLQREGVGGENVDGESLAWAARRLAAQAEPRKILLVLCDGSPFDEATVRAMGRGFLDDHLRAVIRHIEAGPIHLAALGASSDVGRFYRRAAVLPDVESVAETLFAQLGELLVPAPVDRRPTR